jgi:hypothetical protein
MQEFDKERPLATVHVNAMHGFYFREKPNYLATVLVVAMHNLFFFLFFDLQSQIVIDIFLLCNLGHVCFLDFTFRETTFQTFLCLFAIRKVGQRKTLSGQRKTFSSQRKHFSVNGKHFPVNGNTFRSTKNTF